MKSTVSLLSILLCLSQPFSYAQPTHHPVKKPTPTAPKVPPAPPATPTPAPVPAPSPTFAENQDINLAQATSTFQLEHMETQPTYTNEQEPATCYNQVQQGTKQECETLNDHECTTTNQNQCTTVNNPVCQQVPQQVCQDVPTQQCNNVNVPVCQQVPRQQCQDVPECHQVTDTVCHGDPQVCVDVPRSECTTVSQCTSVYDTVCHDETQQQCQTVDQQQCQTEYQQQCQDNYQQQCQVVPVQSCTDTPYQSCQTVPNMVDVPYACTQTVPVQTGIQVSKHVMATVNVVLKNVQNVDLSQEQLTAALSEGADDITLTIGKSSQKVIFHVIKKDQAINQVSAVDSTILTTFTLEVFSVDQLNAIGKEPITNGALHSAFLNFAIQGFNLTNLPVSVSGGHLRMTYQKSGFLGIKSTQTLVDSDFSGGNLKTNAGYPGLYELDFSTFNLGATIPSQNYTLSLDLTYSLNLNRNEVLNPYVMDQVSLPQVSGSLVGVPVN